MSENTIMIFGVVILIAGIILGIAFVEVKDRTAQSIINWLDGSYERILYTAISEFHKTECKTDALFLWKENYELIIHLRLNWLSKVRKRLATIHRVKENLFHGAVAITTESDDITLHLRPWTLVHLNVAGEEIGSYDGEEVTRLTTSNGVELQGWLQSWPRAMMFVIKDHSGKVVRTVSRDEVLPNATGSVPATST